MDLKVVRFDQNHRSCVRVSTQSPNPILRQSPLFQPLVFARVIIIVCNPVKSGTKWKKTGLILLPYYSNPGWLGYQA